MVATASTSSSPHHATLLVVDDNTVSFYKASTLTASRPARVSCLAYNHTGLVAALALQDASVELVSIPTNQVVEKLTRQQLMGDNSDPESVLRSVSFGGKSRYLCLVISGSDSAVIIYDLKKGIVARRFDVSTPLKAYLSGDILYVATKHTLEAFLVKESTRIRCVACDECIVDMDLHPSRGVVVVDETGKVSAYDQELQSFDQVCHFSGVQQVQCLPETPNCAILSTNRVAVYDTSSQTPQDSLRWDASVLDATCMTWSRDRVAVGNAHGQVQIYDRLRDSLVESIQSGTRAIRHLAFPPSTAAVASPPPVVAPTIHALPAADRVALVQSQVEELRDDVFGALQSLHVDMLRQFQLQSEDLRRALDRQSDALDLLVADNASLRRENASLQQELVILRQQSASKEGNDV